MNLRNLANEIQNTILENAPAELIETAAARTHKSTDGELDVRDLVQCSVEAMLENLFDIDNVDAESLPNGKTQ